MISYCSERLSYYKTTRNMNKLAIALAFILMACNASAQTLDSIPHHVVGYYGPNGWGEWENILQLKDGNVLFLHLEGIDSGPNPLIVGNDYFKVSRHGAELLDTLFVYDSDPPFFLFAKNPNNDDHIRVGIVHDSVSGGSFLQIFPFDNDLKFDTLNEVFVQLSDTIVFSCWKGSLINQYNDLILTYEDPCVNNSNYDIHFACFGLDGTLKHENAISNSFIPVTSGYLGFGIFNESPLEYYYCGRKYLNNGAECFVCYLLDSLFQYKDSFTITENALGLQNPGSGLKYNFGWEEGLLPYGDDFIFCSRCVGSMNGVCLVRYDKQTLEQKNMVLFKSVPMVNGGSASPIQLGKDSEGSIYFSYDTQNIMVTDKGQVAVVKLDANLNVQWQRFCLEPEGYYRHGSLMTVLDDGGVAVCGAYWGRPEVFFLIVNDDYDGMEEQGIIVRPYAYYPNPTKNELHLQYSPDVTPKQIELYDLQGRLVQTQRNGLESINLEGLSAGTYTMRVTMEDGKVFSDKVVKE